MSPDLENQLISQLIMDHPLPWSIEHDWTVEVRDAKGVIVIKLRTHDEANELIALAVARQEEFNRADAEIEKMLADGESEPERESAKESTR